MSTPPLNDRRLPNKYLYIDGNDYVTISHTAFPDTSSFTIAVNTVYADKHKTKPVGHMHLKLMQVFEKPGSYMLNLTNTTHIFDTETTPDHVIEMRSFQQKTSNESPHVVHGWDFKTIAKVNDGKGLTKWAPVHITLPIGSTMRKFKFKKFIKYEVDEPAELNFL